MRRRLLLACVGSILALVLSGCSTMRSIESASGDFSKLAESATKLADASASTIERAKESMAVMDEHMGSIGAELKEIVPKLAKDTRVLVKTFEQTTREMGAATTAAIEQTSASLEELTPSLKKTLGAVAETTRQHGVAIEKIGEDFGVVTKSLSALVDNIKENSKSNRVLLREIQQQLGASMKAAERTLDQTAKSLENLEHGLLDTLQGTTKTLTGINRVLRLEAEDDDELNAINTFGKRLESIVKLLIWIFVAGGVLLIVMTTLVIYDRITARKRLRLQLAALGVDASTLG